MYKIFIIPVGKQYAKVKLYREQPSIFRRYKTVAVQYLPASDLWIKRGANREELSKRLESVVAAWGVAHRFTYSPDLIVDTRVDYKDISLPKAMLWEVKKIIEGMLWLAIFKMKKRQAKKEARLFEHRVWIISNSRGMPMTINKRQLAVAKQKGVVSKSIGFVDLLKISLWDSGVAKATKLVES